MIQEVSKDPERPTKTSWSGCWLEESEVSVTETVSGCVDETWEAWEWLEAAVLREHSHVMAWWNVHWLIIEICISSQRSDRARSKTPTQCHSEKAETFMSTNLHDFIYRRRINRTVQRAACSNFDLFPVLIYLLYKAAWRLLSGLTLFFKVQRANIWEKHYKTRRCVELEALKTLTCLRTCNSETFQLHPVLTEMCCSWFYLHYTWRSPKNTDEAH